MEQFVLREREITLANNMIYFVRYSERTLRDIKFILVEIGISWYIFER